MRLLETHKISVAILVSAARTDLGDAGERASGYFDMDWDWEAMKPNEVHPPVPHHGRSPDTGGRGALCGLEAYGGKLYVRGAGGALALI